MELGECELNRPKGLERLPDLPVYEAGGTGMMEVEAEIEGKMGLGVVRISLPEQLATSLGEKGIGNLPLIYLQGRSFAAGDGFIKNPLDKWACLRVNGRPLVSLEPGHDDFEALIWEGGSSLAGSPFVVRYPRVAERGEGGVYEEWVCFPVTTPEGFKLIYCDKETYQSVVCGNDRLGVPAGFKTEHFVEKTPVFGNGKVKEKLYVHRASGEIGVGDNKIVISGVTTEGENGPNEDMIGVVTFRLTRYETSNSRVDEKWVIAGVFDGLGGEVRGGWASRAAYAGMVEAAIEEENHLGTWRSDDGGDDILDRVLKKMEQQVQETGGFTTASLALVSPTGRVYWAHVGDTRIYVGGQCITQDHSLAAEAKRGGGERPDIVDEGVGKDKLTRCLGLKGARFDRGVLQLQPGETVLVCSDGYWGAARDMSGKGNGIDVKRGHELEAVWGTAVNYPQEVPAGDHSTVVTLTFGG